MAIVSIKQMNKIKKEPHEEPLRNLCNTAIVCYFSLMQFTVGKNNKIK